MAISEHPQACTGLEALRGALIRARRRLGALERRLADPRAINPLYVFGVGLTVLLPIWFLFLKG
jgi:hypothetical protein